ncbi:membrane protein [Streptomyces cinereoruber]|uniref:Membrane protein n=1 Tax=Streptomyces cinereoruber TaxID=67260 RepID=A0AAV4KIN0_9ACTN|nr:drug/metabolite transporter (DMT)-like permease [Streptomyces cinereoruber]NIH62772.1 drug/metabolite transporter (DMT)-like permease [Streptomyces cinereoruber]GGR22005.1 membrane protein [Streptomyces cinereoruber]
MNANSLRGVLLVTLAYALVGASFTANSLLGAYPYAGGQAIRYGAACLLLLPLLGRGGLAPLRLLTARHWLRLAALAAVGMVGFNLAVLAAERTAEPAVPGVLVGCAPVVVAVLVPLAEGRRPARAVLYGALLVTAGAFTVQGWGRTDAAGIGWSLAALAGEVGFTVLAVPVLRILGPKLLTAAVCGIGTAEAALLGLLVDGTGFVRMPTGTEAGALAWQAVLATVVGFVLFYMGVQRIGVERATLFTGAIPVAAALSAALVAGAAFGLPQVAGSLLVGAGAALGTGLFTRTKAASAAAVQEHARDEGRVVVHGHVAAAGQPDQARAGQDVLRADALTAQEQPVAGAPGDGDRHRGGEVVAEEHGPARRQGLVEAGRAAQRERLGDDRLG